LTRPIFSALLDGARIVQSWRPPLPCAAAAIADKGVLTLLPQLLSLVCTARVKCWLSHRVGASETSWTARDRTLASHLVCLAVFFAHSAEPGSRRRLSSSLICSRDERSAQPVEPEIGRGATQELQQPFVGVAAASSRIAAFSALASLSCWAPGGRLC